MEFWDLYNNDREKVCTIERNEKIPQGLNKLVVHVCIFNPKGEMLIQQRHINKKVLPGVWDVSIGGGVQSGEKTKDAAHRETLEELGLDIDFSNARKHFSIDFDFGFDDYYLIEKDISIDDVKFSDGEVQDVKWATLDDILRMIDTGEFIKYHKSLIRYIFECRNDRGGLKNK